MTRPWRQSLELDFYTVLTNYNNYLKTKVQKDEGQKKNKQMCVIYLQNLTSLLYLTISKNNMSKCYQCVYTVLLQVHFGIKDSRR